MADQLQELQTAVEALQEGRGGPAGNHLLDPRFLEKPGKFDGAQAHWKDWSEQVQAFCDVADVALGEAMKRYAKAEVGVSMDLMGPEDKKQATKLWYIMILLCKGDAAQKRRTISDKGNGLECWRVFFSEWEPQHQNRFGNLLLQILNTRFQGNSIAEIESWETKIREYEGSTEGKETVAPHIRSATVLNGLPKDSQLLSHLQLNADRFDSWEKMRAGLAAYFLNRKTWGNVGSAGGVDAMDLSAIDRGKGGGKDRANAAAEKKKKEEEAKKKA